MYLGLVYLDSVATMCAPELLGILKAILTKAPNV